MNGSIPNGLLMRFLQATPEQKTAIERILDGKSEAPRPVPTGPLLMMMGNAANLLGVSRATIWRMVKLGKLEQVEILPGTRRVRRADVEAIAGQKSEVRSRKSEDGGKAR